MDDRTDYGRRLAAELFGKRDAIRRLYDEWNARKLTRGDLRDLLPQIWTRDPTDSPETIIGTPACVQLFQSTGFIAIPNNLEKPHGPLTIYRGASQDRRMAMSWSQSKTTAGHFRDGKHQRLKIETFIFQATAPEHTVLALFNNRQEHEVVVDPTLITNIRPIN